MSGDPFCKIHGLGPCSCAYPPGSITTSGGASTGGRDFEPGATFDQVFSAMEKKLDEREAEHEAFFGKQKLEEKIIRQRRALERALVLLNRAQSFIQEALREEDPER